MFFIDGEKLDLRENSNPFVKKIKEGMDFLEKMGLPVTFKFPDYLVRTDPDNQGKMVYPMPFTLQLVDYVDGVEWRWCKTFSYDKDRNIEYKPTSLEVERITQFGKDELEIAFFMYFISSRCLDGGNVNTIKDKWFMLEDINKEARIFADKQRKQADLSFYIYSDKSPLKANELIKLSKALFIPTVDKNLDIVRNNMYNNINGNEAKLNLFYQLMNDSVNLEARYCVQEAFDGKMLSVEQNGNAKSVFYKSDANTRTGKLCDIPPMNNNNVMDYVYRYYSERPDELDILKQAIVNYGKSREVELDDIVSGKPTVGRGRGIK